MELTAAAGRAIDDGVLVLFASGFAASPDDPARSEQAPKTSDQTIIARQGTAPNPVALSESRKAAVPRNEEIIDSDSTAEMMVKIFKDYQNKAFDNIKVSLNAAIDHAKYVVEPRVRSEATSKESSASRLESNFLTVLKEATTKFRAEAAELMKRM